MTPLAHAHPLFSRNKYGIAVHSQKALPLMERAGRLAATCLDQLVLAAKPNITTQDLDDLASQFAKKHGAVAAPLNYRGFPKSICTSPNHVVCHGIPSNKQLRNGDILNIDVTLIVDGWHGDTSRMVFVGPPSVRAKRLVDVTYNATIAGVNAAQPGKRFGAVGHAIETLAKKHRLAVVRDFCGHGLGTVFHDEPNVPHYGNPDDGPVIEPGMFFTVEPMLNLGKPEVKILADGWTAVTRDRSLSAQFEHTVAITDKGPRILTLSPNNLHQPPFLP